MERKNTCSSVDAYIYIYVYTLCQINYAFSLFRKYLCIGGRYLLISWHYLFSKLAKIFTLKDSLDLSTSSIRGLKYNETWKSFLLYCYRTSWLSAQHPHYYCTVMYQVHGNNCSVSHLVYICTHPLHYIRSWDVAYVSKYFCHVVFSVSRIYSVYDWPVWSLLRIPPW